MARRTRRPEPEPPVIELKRIPGYEKLDPSNVTGRARRKLEKMRRDQMRDAVRGITPQLLQEMAKIALSSKDGDAQRFKALKDLLDRGWGTPGQAPRDPDEPGAEDAVAVRIVGGLPD